MGMNSIIFLAVDPEVIKNALLNTVMCISIVFIMLIFISFVISRFKYISKIEAYFRNKKVSAEPVKPVIEEPEADVYEEELSDDLELAAVITAAIYAYEESMGTLVPADGLVVRSIRKANKSRWQKSSV